MTTPTQDIDESAARIGSMAELAAHLEAGSKLVEDWRIGTEHEKFGFALADHTPLPYDGPCSIRAMLEGIGSKFNWQPVLEGGRIIGLKKNGASVSLEPGGQFELSGAPLCSIHETCVEVSDHLREVKVVADSIGAGFLGLGFAPTWRLADVPMMPKARYHIMREYMTKVGRLGREMMFRTCTVQVNLDFGSEADMVKKLRVSLALQPIATALFANSPFAEGRPNGYRSYRSHIWTDTDPDRSGMMPVAFEDGFGFERFVDYALDVPMYFVRRKGQYLNYAGASFRDFLNGTLPGLEGERPTLADWDDHLSTIFPEVRLKQFLEMRGSDAGPWRLLCAHPAFWVGVLYDTNALDEAWQLVRHWTAADREALRRSVPAMGLNAPIAGRALIDVAQDALDIARRGLKRRAFLNDSGDDESGFLGPLADIVSNRQTCADGLLAAYNGPWERNISRIFTEAAF
jgi:glutamate--cysteine ligase